MYVAKEFVASAVDDIAVDFTCVHCGHKAVADVIAVGYGAAEAPFLIGQQQARAAAAAQAAKALPDNALLAVGLTSCPRCGKQDPAALRRGWLSAALSGLATWLGVLTFVLVLLAVLVGYAASSPLIIAGAVAFFALVLAVLARWQFGKLMRDAQSRVTFRQAP
jgi:predicted lysophospholipase L1 biosynthesis ABC-type transport system permease subunit